jgi:hypothetical protein
MMNQIKKAARKMLIIVMQQTFGEIRAERRCWTKKSDETLRQTDAWGAVDGGFCFNGDDVRGGKAEAEMCAKTQTFAVNWALLSNAYSVGKCRFDAINCGEKIIGAWTGE